MNENHHIDHQHQRDLRRGWNQQICQALAHAGIRPKIVGDWGCGYGFFLNRVQAVFNTQQVRGFDADYVDMAYFDGDPATFQPTDLNNDFPVYPCDLAACLEVAEHLEPARSDLIVERLCQSSKIVLFSAAIPHQPGRGHINCQYSSQWAKRFLRHHYLPVDLLRTQFWGRHQQALWFRQNLLLFIELNTLMLGFPHLVEHICRLDTMDMVHPMMWESAHHTAPIQKVHAG